MIMSNTIEKLLWPYTPHMFMLMISVLTAIYDHIPIFWYAGIFICITQIQPEDAVLHDITKTDHGCSANSCCVTSKMALS